MTIRDKLAKALIWLAVRVWQGYWPAGVSMHIQPPEHIAAKMYAEQRERAQRVIDQALANAGFSALHRGTMQDPVLDLPAITTKPITEVN